MCCVDQLKPPPTADIPLQRNSDRFRRSMPLSSHPKETGHGTPPCHRRRRLALFSVNGVSRLVIHVKRIYESPESTDGYRLLVDRLWPRGVSKKRASLDAWMKEAGPSSELRRWFGHDVSRWLEFKRRYGAELDTRQDVVTEILSLAIDRPVTLLYSARDPDHNQAVALAEYLTALRSKRA